MSAERPTLSAASAVMAPELPPHLQSPTRAKKWVADLPVANIPGTAKQLHQAIVAIQGAPLRPKRTLQLVAQLRAPLAIVLEALEKQVVGKAFPLSAKDQQISELIVDYHFRIALICHRALSRLVNKGEIAMASRSIAREALFLGMLHGSEAFYAGCKYYLVAPGRLWRMLNTMYALARQNQMTHKSAKDPQTQKRASIHQLYVRCLLLEMASPSRMDQTALGVAWKHCVQWASEVVVSSARSDQEHWRVQSRQDLPPAWGQKGDLMIDISPLAQPKSKKRLPIFSRKTSEDDGLLEHMLLDWGEPRDRLEKRVRGGHRLDTVVGLNACHYVISGGVPLSYLLPDKAEGLTLSESQNRSSWAPSDADVQAPEILQVDVLDQSFAGYRLKWSAAAGARLRVGAVVAMSLASAEQDDNRMWVIGSLRWMHQAEDGGMEAGICLISRMPYAVAAMLGGQGKRRRLERGILISDAGHDADRKQLLLSTVGIDEEEAVRFYERKDSELQECRGSLQGVAEQTQQYQLFNLRLSEDQQKQSASVSTEAGLDALWSSL